MGHFAEWKPTWNDFLFGTAENGHQSCGPEQRGFIIVCGPRSVTLGVMRNQMEWQRKLLQPGMNAHGYTTVGNVLKPQVFFFFLSSLSIIASTSGGGHITCLQEVQVNLSVL